MTDDTKCALKAIGGGLLFMFSLPVMARLFYHWCEWVMGPLFTPMK